MNKKNNSSEMRLIQLNSYVRPKLEENKAKNWVLNGRNNDFYQYIIDRYNGSPTNAAIINSYIDLIYGNGLTSKDQIGLDKLNEVLKPRELRKIIADFELFGEASIQVIKKKGKNLLPELYQMPKNLIAPSIENEDDEIEGYWYSKDWTKQYQNVPVFYPTFGTSNEPIEIFNIKPYKAGKIYFSDPDYLAGLPYAEMEEEIANLNINSIKQGLSAGYVINIPDGKNMSDDEKDELESKIKAKLTGSTNASQFVLSFNGRDAEITVTPFPVNENIHKQWEFLTGEARQQLMTAHRVTSPMLFGIKDATGFGNNAEEMDTAEAQLIKRVIKPKQQYILNALEEIMLFYGIEIDLDFIPLSENPDVTNRNEIKDTSSIITRTGLSEKKNILDSFINDFGESIDLDTWELIDEREVDYEEEEKIDLQLASTGTARPNAKSAQDSDIYKVRYKYTGSKSPEREFCQKMMAADKVYRKEDIMAMGEKAVNKGWGPKGADTYSIWLYKGGGDCHHKWYRVIYARKDREKGVDVNNPNAVEVTPAQTRKETGFIPEKNNKLVYTEPKDMPYNGFLPTNKRFQ